MPRLVGPDPDELAALEEELNALDDSRPARQLRAIQEKRDNLADVLARRLNAGELTYGRYLTTAEQVYSAALDNIREVAVGLQSISAIDEDYIEQRLGELDGEQVAESDRERTELEARRDLRDTQSRKVTELLDQNESAMTVMDQTATALADAQIGRKPEDAEAAMAALKELADRASKYATE
jgi:hypothetical protein